MQELRENVISTEKKKDFEIPMERHLNVIMGNS
jgi:hypothetical protein